MNERGGRRRERTENRGGEKKLVYSNEHLFNGARKVSKLQCSTTINTTSMTFLKILLLLFILSKTILFVDAVRDNDDDEWSERDNDESMERWVH